MGKYVPSSVRPRLWDFSQRVFGADAQKRSIYREVLEIQGRDALQSRILDFGCATGNVALAFSDCAYTGIDIDEALVARGVAKFADIPNLCFVAGDVFEVSWPHDGFDKILFAGTAHHLDDRLIRRVLVRLRTMLRGDGAIYFIDPVRTGREGRVLRGLMAADQGKHHRSLEEYVSLFGELDFTVHHQMTIQPRGTLFPQPLYGVLKAS